MSARRLRNAESGRQTGAVHPYRATAPTRPRGARRLAPRVLCGILKLCFNLHSSEKTRPP